MIPICNFNQTITKQTLQTQNTQAMKKSTLFLMLMMSYLSIFSQRNCGLVEVIEHAKSIDPDAAERLRQNEIFTKNKITAISENRSFGGSIITIPVVVHVLYTNSNENISDAQIQSQIDVLNEDFRRQNPDQTNQWSAAADTQIEFCLAKTAPDGTLTNGITRKQTNVANWNADKNYMKRTNTGGVDPWDQNLYLNIWLVPNPLNSDNETLLGYAYYPGAYPAMDGVVVKTDVFGRIGYVSPPYDGGRTATHEVGHYLNLIHIWGDGACGVDDLVNDTPPSDEENTGCPGSHTSCGSPDMFQNYMDYTNDNCLNLFTQGQADRMRAQFESGGLRVSLGKSDKCNPPVATNDPCDGVPAFVGGQFYGAGQQVINNGVLYQSNGAGGWTNLGTCTTSGSGGETNTGTDNCSGIQAFQSGQFYAAGEQVVNNGTLYQSNGAGGWTNLGACGSSGGTEGNETGGGSGNCDGVQAYQGGQNYSAGTQVVNNGTLYESNGAGGWTNLGACTTTTNGGGTTGGTNPCDNAQQYQGGQSYPAGTYVINNGTLYQSSATGGWINLGACTNTGTTGGTPSCENAQPYQSGTSYPAGTLVVNNGILYESNGAGGWTNLGACAGGRVPFGFTEPVHIYPNPANSFIQVDGNMASSSRIKIFSTHGKLVKEEQLNDGQINLAGLSNGVYFIEINDGLQRVIKKFIKQ